MIEKPYKVVLAIRIMWGLWSLGSLFLIAVFTSAFFAGNLQKEIIVPLGIVYFLVISLTGLLVRAVSKGKNWARLLYTIIACISIALTVFGQIVKPQITLPSLIITITLTIAYSIIIYLLFHRESKILFSRSKTTAAQQYNQADGIDM